MLWEECCNESSISVKVYQSDKMAHSAQLTVSSASVHISEVIYVYVVFKKHYHDTYIQENKY